MIYQLLCHDLIIDNIDEVTDVRLKALKEIEKDKARVAKAHKKKSRANPSKWKN
jgi:hypothetical protein